MCGSESADEIAARARTAAGWGIDHLVVGVSQPQTPEAFEVVAAAAPQVTDIAAASWARLHLAATHRLDPAGQARGAG